MRYAVEQESTISLLISSRVRTCRSVRAGVHRARSQPFSSRTSRFIESSTVEGLGGELLWDALSRAVKASEIAAARLVVVDAIDASAARFYERYGFIAVPENPHRLVQKMSDVVAALRT